MKNFKVFWLSTIALCSLFAACKKDKNTEDQLPTATQTGAGTFGCKINGKVFIPKGSSGTGTPNPKVQYDIGLNGLPYLTIDSKQQESGNVSAGVFISFGSLTQPKFYPVTDTVRFSIGWSSLIGNCGMTTLDNSVSANGGGTITRLDIPNRIISGTFSFNAIRPGCDTLRVTDGRFDIKF
jgi:hypothetical protein